MRPATVIVRVPIRRVMIEPILEPVNATYPATQNAHAENTHSSAPAGCARKALAKSRSAAYANDVVIPQVRHGFPNHAAHEHAGRPSWRCVPCPAAEGSNHDARPSTSRITPANAAHANREETSTGIARM
jgi:hypothetical protein